jgi:tetratricopeptide (TPR) repeat protein
VKLKKLETMRIEWMEKHMADAERLILDNKVDEGLTLLNNLLYDEPGYGSLHNHIGWAYLYYAHNVGKAKLHLKAAIAFDADFAPPYLHLGTLYLRSEKFTKALATLEQGVTKTNANRVAFFECIGQVHELKCDFSRAIKAYKEAMKASVISFETNTLMDGIKRCRRKRVTMFFTF